MWVKCKRCHRWFVMALEGESCEHCGSIDQ